MKTKDKIKIFVIDYDNCAIDDFGDISYKLISQGKKGGYIGFYGCTHRSYLEVTSIVEMIKKAQEKKSFMASIAQQYFTHLITKNFAIESNLPCIAVSTFDDAIYPECGIAYKKVIKPYEIDGIIPKENQHVSAETILKTKEPGVINTKNPQLLQIAQHAAINHPDAREIELDYVDDKLELCNSALEAAKQADWPAYISLNVYHHNAKESSEIKFIGKSKRESALVVYQSTEQTLFRMFDRTEREVQNNMDIVLTADTNNLSAKFTHN